MPLANLQIKVQSFLLDRRRIYAVMHQLAGHVFLLLLPISTTCSPARPYDPSSYSVVVLFLTAEINGTYSAVHALMLVHRDRSFLTASCSHMFKIHPALESKFA
jgi:hypothetical protein